MKKEEIKKLYKKKLIQFKKNNYLYLEKNNPKISDAEFDLLKKEILELEKKRDRLTAITNKSAQDIVDQSGGRVSIEQAQKNIDNASKQLTNKGYNKPLIISTGMANDAEIGEAVETATKFGTGELTLLHCVSGYPSPPDEYNLRTIADMKKRFGVNVGLSDHTLCNVTAISAVALGAVMIEKHVTLSREGGGPDDSFSLEEDGLLELCSSTKVAWQALGKVNYEETRQLFLNRVLQETLDDGTPAFYNSNILGRYYRKDYHDHEKNKG